MKRLLLVNSEELDRAELGPMMRRRQEGLEIKTVESIDQARRELEGRWDAVLLSPGPKRLSFEAFHRAALAQEAPPRLLLIGEEAPGFTTIHEGSPERMTDQVFAVLGVVRSASFDCRVLGSIGVAGLVVFSRVAWRGALEPLLLAQVSDREFQPAELLEAQRAGQLAGPGLAKTLEVFWDDPRPHLLQYLPPGVSLARMLRQRPAWGVELALALARGVVEGVCTLHAAGFSAGTLRPPAVWVGADGEVSLLGHGLTQLPFTRQTYYGLPSEAPPEEYGTQLAPQIPGDAFRLGILLAQVAVNDSPVRELSPMVYLQREWRPAFEANVDELGARPRELLEILLQPEPSDRPRGALLREVVAGVAPAEGKRLLAEAVAWSQSAPDTVW